jgi:hypothetical protein
VSYPGLAPAVAAESVGGHNVGHNTLTGPNGSLSGQGRRSGESDLPPSFPRAGHRPALREGPHRASPWTDFAARRGRRTGAHPGARATIKLYRRADEK